MRYHFVMLLRGLALALAISAIPADAILFSGSGGGGGGGSAAQITTLLVNNTSAGTVSNQQVSTLIPLGTSDMTSGNKLQIRKNDGTTVVSNVQQDACATWKQNGNQKLCAVSFVEPDSMTAGQTLTYQVWKTSGSPVTTPNVSTANITANTNFVLKTSYDPVPNTGLGAQEVGTLDLMDVNYVLNNCTQWNNSTGFGTDPACGWEITATGPSRYGLHLFMFATRESDAKIHKWLRTDFWIDFWGSGATPCPCSVLARTALPNVYGPLASGTIGATTAVNYSGYLFGADLYNGASRIPVNFGGPNDSRAGFVTFDHTWVDQWGATGGVVLSGAWAANLSYFPSRTVPMAFTAGGGTLPASVTASKPYFLDFTCRTVNNCFTWSTTKFSLYNWQTGAAGTASNIFGGSINVATNGTCSSNCTGFPLVRVNQWTRATMAGTDGGRIWIGANGLAMTSPPVMAEENFTYLTQTTHAVPPYLTNLWGNMPSQATKTDPGTLIYYPNVNLNGGNINVGGDNPDDIRIAQIDRLGATALFAPFDPVATANSQIYAQTMDENHAYYFDEHKGILPVMNRGHDKAGSIYPLMGADNYTISCCNGGATFFPAIGDWNNDANETYVQSAYYGPLLEPSHMPLPQQAMYVLTGLPEHLEDMQLQTNGMVTGLNTSTTLGVTNYYRALSVLGTNQTRGIAWGKRMMQQTDYFTPDSAVSAQYFSDIVKDDLAFDAAMINTLGSISGGFPVGGVTTYEAALGLHWNDVRPVDNTGVGQIGHGEFQPWMDDYLFQVEALEKLRGEYADATTFINYFQKFAFGRMDSNQGGCLWAGPTRLLSLFAPLTTYDNYFDFTTLPADWTTAYTHASAGSRTFTGTLSGNTLTVSAYGTYGDHGVVPTDTGFPWPGGSVILGSGVPANTIALSGSNPFTVSGAGGTSSGPFVTEVAGGWAGLLNPAGANPGAPPWAGCAANAALTPITLDTTQSAADSPTSLITIAAGTLAYASWLNLPGATTDYNFFRNVEANGLNPGVNSNTGASGVPLSFFTYTYGGFTSTNPAFAIGPAGATYP